MFESVTALQLCGDRTGCDLLTYTQTDSAFYSLGLNLAFNNVKPKDWYFVLWFDSGQD